MEIKREHLKQGSSDSKEILPKEIKLDTETYSSIKIEHVVNELNNISLLNQIPDPIQELFKKAKDAIHYSCYHPTNRHDSDISISSVLKTALIKKLGDNKSELENLIRKAIKKNLLVDTVNLNIFLVAESTDNKLSNVHNIFNHQRSDTHSLLISEEVEQLRACADTINQVYSPYYRLFYYGK